MNSSYSVFFNSSKPKDFIVQDGEKKANDLREKRARKKFALRSS
jgi:hypothetical protein